MLSVAYIRPNMVQILGFQFHLKQLINIGWIRGEQKATTSLIYAFILGEIQRSNVIVEHRVHFKA